MIWLVIAMFLPPEEGVYARRFEWYHEAETAISLKVERPGIYSATFIRISSGKIKATHHSAQWDGMGMWLNFPRGYCDMYYVFMPYGRSRLPINISHK